MNTPDAHNAFDVDWNPRPVMAFRSDTRSPPEWQHVHHEHSKAQLLYTVRGIFILEVEEGIWIVPPQCAVWIPPGIPHSANAATGETECYCLFVSPDAVPGLPTTCCTLSVSTLLRELLLSAAAMDDLYALEGREGRLIATLLDELAAAPVEDMHLPMPTDKRLRTLAETMLKNPGDKSTLPMWAERLGMSERSLSRMFVDETGLSFGRWRRQLHIVLSLQWMTRGLSVQTVAMDLGYESASGFVTMFRKILGKPPAAYLADRNRNTASLAEGQVPAINFTDTFG